MKILNTKLKDCYYIKNDVKIDDRGVFIKLFNNSSFFKENLNLQINEYFYSKSKYNVIRGMHYQTKPYQVKKLVSCIHGEILDVVLDIRKNSLTYGFFDFFLMNDKDSGSLLIPEGVAHGFLTVSSESIVSYLQSKEYDKKSDSGILWNSFGMNWKTNNPILSERDKSFISFSDYDNKN